jgi:hypothetical protein
MGDAIAAVEVTFSHEQQQKKHVHAVSQHAEPNNDRDKHVKQSKLLSKGCLGVTRGTWWPVK